MRIGMMWYDKDANDVYKMISAAAAHYFSKFGVPPQRCHVHPTMFKRDNKIPGQANKMKIVLDKSIQPKHVWVGVIQ